MNWCGWPKQVTIVGRVPLVGGWDKDNRCERFGLECPAINLAFRHYVDGPSSCPHEISQLKAIIHTLPMSTNRSRRKTADAICDYLCNLFIFILLCTLSLLQNKIYLSDCERVFSSMNVIATKTRNRLLVKTISNLLFFRLVGPPQAEFEPATACRLQVSLSCAVLCDIVSLQYLSWSSLRRLAGLHCRLFLSHGLQVVTREVHRSSLMRLVCPAQEHFICLILLIIYIWLVSSPWPRGLSNYLCIWCWVYFFPFWFVRPQVCSVLVWSVSSASKCHSWQYTWVIHMSLQADDN